MRKTIVALAVAVASVAGPTGTAYAWGDEPGCREAARLIVDRADSGQEMFEDLTWMGAPAIVGECNDVFMDAYTGPWTREDVTDWLRATQV